MKKAVAIILMMVYSWSNAQDQAPKKFQIGASYSFTSNKDVFSNPISGYANYQIKKWDDFDLNAGMRVFYFNSTEGDYISDKWGFNPNLSTSYYFKNTMLRSYLAIGYYFDSYKANPTIIGTITSPERDIKTNGLTFTPGIKYFLNPSIFIDANLSLLFSNTEDKYYKTTSNTNAFFNIGMGVAF